MKIIISCCFALALAGTLAPEAVAQSSCGGWFSKCAARCKALTPDDKNCPSANCQPKLATCRQTGCWQEIPRFGGENHCNLKMS